MPVFVEYALIVLAVVVFAAIIAPPVIAFYLYFFDRKQRQHSIVRSYPILGCLRYLTRTWTVPIASTSSPTCREWWTSSSASATRAGSRWE
jgi:hypothetical protein